MGFHEKGNPEKMIFLNFRRAIWRAKRAPIGPRLGPQDAGKIVLQYGDHHIPGYGLFGAQNPGFLAWILA